MKTTYSIIIFLSIILGLLIYSLNFSSTNLSKLKKLSNQNKVLLQKNQQLTEENKVLKDKIIKIQENPDIHVEHLARQHHNLVMPSEDYVSFDKLDSDTSND